MIKIAFCTKKLKYKKQINCLQLSVFYVLKKKLINNYKKCVIINHWREIHLCNNEGKKYNGINKRSNT